MSRRSAPSALRRPISFVRSVTETSMMFITPTPPTTSAIAAMRTMTPEIAFVTACIWASIFSAVKIAKSFGALNGTLRRARSTIVPSSMTRSTSSGDRGIVAMWIVSSCEFFVCGKCRSNVVIGIMTRLSGWPPKPEEPFLLNVPTTWRRLPFTEIDLAERVLPLEQGLGDVLPDDARRPSRAGRRSR